MALNADQLAAGISIAHSCFAQGRLKDSEILLEGLITLQANNPYLHMLLGSVLLQQGRLDESVASFNRAIEISPENISALTNRGEIHLKQGRLKEAAEDFRLRWPRETAEGNRRLPPLQVVRAVFPAGNQRVLCQDRAAVGDSAELENRSLRHSASSGKFGDPRH